MQGRYHRFLKEDYGAEQSAGWNEEELVVVVAVSYCNEMNLDAYSYYYYLLMLSVMSFANYAVTNDGTIDGDDCSGDDGLASFERPVVTIHLLQATPT